MNGDAVADDSVRAHLYEADVVVTVVLVVVVDVIDAFVLLLISF